jgi:Tol biopolymer transport system component
MDPSTGALLPFLGGISAEFSSFSSDGKSVAYVLFPEGKLWKADQDGSNRIQLAGGPDQIVDPRWLPDAKQIVFGTTSFDGLHRKIHIVSVDGGKPQRLLPGDGADIAGPFISCGLAATRG